MDDGLKKPIERRRKGIDKDEFICRADEELAVHAKTQEYFTAFPEVTGGRL